MDFQTQKQIAADFLKRVTMSADRVLALSDQIHEASRDHLELTALCQFGRSMQVRRLRSVRPQNWNQTDYSNAQQICTSIESLIKDSHKDDHALALAVLGVETTQLDAALRSLNGARLKSDITSELTTSIEVEKITLPEGQSGMNGDSNASRTNQSTTSRSASGKRRKRSDD